MEIMLLYSLNQHLQILNYNVLTSKSREYSLQYNSVSYRQREAEFKSDNLSTISVIKEVISKEATKKKISIKITHRQ